MTKSQVTLELLSQGFRRLHDFNVYFTEDTDVVYSELRDCVLQVAKEDLIIYKVLDTTLYKIVRPFEKFKRLDKLLKGVTPEELNSSNSLREPYESAYINNKEI